MGKVIGEKALFDLIWKEREHKSFLSGQVIRWYDVGCFAHLVAKSKREDLRLNKMNICILTKAEHFLFDNGTEDQRMEYAKIWKCDWNKLYELRNKFMRTKIIKHTDKELEKKITEELKGLNAVVTTYREETGDEVNNKIGVVVWSVDFKSMLSNETFHSLKEVRDWYKK